MKRFMTRIKRRRSTSARQLWRQAHQLRDSLPAYNGDPETLRAAIEAQRDDGRTIRIIELTVSLGQQTGLWIPLPHVDLIFISGDLPAGLRQQTILHELAHIAWNHEPIHLETHLRQAGELEALAQLKSASPEVRAEITAEIISDLFSEDRNGLVCGRAKDDFTSVEEQQAEMLSRLFMADEMNAGKGPADAVFGTY